MDINSTETALAIEDEGIVVEIMGPTGDPEMFGDPEHPVTITVAGTYSKKYRRADEWQRQQVIALRGRKLTGEASLRMLSEFVARCTLGWPLGAFVLDGAPLPFSLANAITLYDRLPLVREQVEAGMSDHAGFIKKNSPTSVSTSDTKGG